VSNRVGLFYLDIELFGHLVIDQVSNHALNDPLIELIEWPIDSIHRRRESSFPLERPYRQHERDQREYHESR
jgi:hypothetical protein